MKLEKSTTPNGLAAVHVTIPGLRAFSIQTNGDLPLCHGAIKHNETPDKPEHLEEVRGYISCFGTVSQTAAMRFDEEQEEKRAEQLEAAQAQLLRYALLALADLCDQDTGWYYQFSAAAEKVENLTS
jgi:hypothetical protein